MDPLACENKEIEGSILLDLLPLESKETSKAEEPENNKTQESTPEESPEELQENLSTSVDPEVDVADPLALETSSPPENPDCSKDVPEDIGTSNDESRKKKETSLPQTNNSSKLNRSNSKTGNVGKIAVSTPTEPKEVKRKRSAASDQHRDVSSNGIEVKGKRTKIRSTNDNFCWRCHKESVDAKCRACPRSWHRKCMGGPSMTTIDETWICGECATILRAENAETRSEIMADFSIDHLCMILKYIVERMRSCQGSEPFWKAVDLNEVPNYMDYVVRPMDLNLLESNVRSKLYGSTDAFMADAKWIQHNCIVFNTCGGVYADTSKLTNAARQMIKIAKQEVVEIETCPDCYVRGRNLPRPNPSWFIEACRKPHPLIWAKLKGFPFWPAKAMPRLNGQGYVDVRFFGQHDRAWVAPKDVYLYSREPPTPFPRKRKIEMGECIKEISRHARKLEITFGPFQYAPPKTPYNPHDPMQIKILLPDYDPLQFKEPTRSPSITSRRKSPFFKRNTTNKRKLDTVSTMNETTIKFENNSSETSNLRTIEDVRTMDSTIVESARPKKRQKKSLTNNETRKSLDEVSSSIVRSSTTSVASVSRDVGNYDDKTMAMTNGEVEINTSVSKDQTLASEAETSSSTAANVNKSKVKNEKPSIPLKKSIAGLLRTVNARGRFSNHRNSSFEAKNVATVQQTVGNNFKLEVKTNSPKVYKPKARMVDKMNAEKALKSTMKKTLNQANEGGKSEAGKNINGSSIVATNSSGNSTAKPDVISLLNKKNNNKTISSNSLLKTMTKKSPTRIIVVNNGTTESTQIITPTDEVRSRTETLLNVAVKQETKISPRGLISVKPKPSRAKKSFPNKPPGLTNIPPKRTKLSNNQVKPLDIMVHMPINGNENGTDYKLAPPEAGPLSAQLHRGANELAKRMGQLLEEAVRLAAESNLDEIGESVDSHQATVHSLRLQIERMRWQHQQQLTELKHNTDRTLREMRASLEAERLRVIEEIRREAEEERTRCVDETKTKQWCAHCGREALFYCCWNTAYCDHLCQQAHWQSHQRKCAQKLSLSPLGSGSISDPSNRHRQQQQQQRQQQQVMLPLFTGSRDN